MAPAASRNAARQKRQTRIRLTLRGTAERPRLAVFRSLRQISAQIIDDTQGRTLASASSLEKELRAAGGDKVSQAKAVGRLVGERARAAGVGRVISVSTRLAAAPQALELAERDAVDQLAGEVERAVHVAHLERAHDVGMV